MKTRLLLFACMASVAVARDTAPSPSLEEVAHQALRDAHANGFIHVREVSSDRVILHVTAAPDGKPDPTLAINSPVRPLSVIKVFMAASWLEHGLGGAVVDCAPSGGRPLRR